MCVVGGGMCVSVGGVVGVCVFLCGYVCVREVCLCLWGYVSV